MGSTKLEHMGTLVVSRELLGIVRVIRVGFPKKCHFKQALRYDYQSWKGHRINHVGDPVKIGCSVLSFIAWDL